MKRLSYTLLLLLLSGILHAQVDTVRFSDRKGISWNVLIDLQTQEATLRYFYAQPTPKRLTLPAYVRHQGKQYPLTTVKSYVFLTDCPERLTLPATLKRFEANAISSGPYVEVHPDNPCFVAVDGVLFTHGMDTLVCYPRGRRDTVYSIPSTVRHIAPSAFRYTKLRHIEWPSSLQSIGSEAFNGCYWLCDVSLPEGLRVMGREVFGYCPEAFDSVIHLPSTLVRVGVDEYEERHEFSRIEVAPGNPRYRSIDGKLYSAAGDTLLFYPVLRREDVLRLPEGCRVMLPGAIPMHSKWLAIDLPATLEEARFTQRNQHLDHLIAIRLHSPTTLITLREAPVLQAIYIPRGSLVHYQQQLPKFKDKLIEYE